MKILSGFLRFFLKGLKNFGLYIKRFSRTHWIGLLTVFSTTILYFLPVIVQIGTYNPGGDAMFNAWAIARNQHCILLQNCEDYTDANIYYPNKDTMLYSESELSAGVVTLPLKFINDNPIFSYNILTIISFALAGIGMYLLAKYLSRGNEFVAVVSGLIFEFAPFKIAAIYHLQNLSIFCLPFAVLFILKYIDSPRRKYLFGLFVSLLYVFYASWYQMVFVLAALAIIIPGFYVFKLASRKIIFTISSIIIAAVVATLPLAIEYVRFSKENGAPFSVTQQIVYSSSLSDYLIPHSTTLAGNLYHQLKPAAQKNSFNPDSPSNHSFTLYSIGVLVVIFALFSLYRFRKNKRKIYSKDFILHKQAIVLSVVGVVGFILSLGPFLKIKGSHLYEIAGVAAALPMPYVLIDKLIPQLTFIRAVGRWSVLLLFVLCCLLAIAAVYFNKLSISKKKKTIIAGLITLVLAIELMPTSMIAMSQSPQAYDLHPPKVYQYIKNNPSIDNIVIVVSDYDYSYETGLIGFARSEQTMWAGYHNKNIFNGYSGIEPKNYMRDWEDFNDFYPDDVKKIKDKNINYVLVDKELSKNHPDMPGRVASILKEKIYSDKRYDLYKIPEKL